MGWGSRAIRKTEVVEVVDQVVHHRGIEPYPVDWSRLVSLDFETYYDDDYTLRKLTTSEYIRDKRFKAQMVGIKIGRAKTQWYPSKEVRKAVKAIDWKTHALLAHHAHFDGLILSHHFDCHPYFIFDTLSMARALHSNEIGAGLHEVSLFYGGRGKIEGRLDDTKGVPVWSDLLNKRTGPYCVRDVTEMFRIFKAMHERMPHKEMEIIDLIVKMYTEPVLQLDRPLAQKVLAFEIAEKRRIMMQYAQKAEAEGIKLSAEDRRLLGENATEEDIGIRKARKMINSAKFAQLLKEQGVEPPIKISPTWKKLPKEDKEIKIDKKWIFAFSKTDIEFIELEAHANPAIRELVEARLTAKSNSNETRAARFLKLNEGGAPMPVYIKYSAAHTHRLGGGDKTNFQNLKRGGDLRKSLLAPRGHKIVVRDSGQIEARINGWLWGQDDLVENFRIADAYDASVAHLPKAQRPLATGLNRDAYCKFADEIYGREITKADDEERFVAKTCIAEGQLVLTHRGLVPIQDIKLTDWLWDGVEWISHDGLIDQGVRDVITYAGLTATPDHEVFTSDGRIIPFGQAASEMARLQTTGVEGRGIRFCDDLVVANSSRQRLSVRQGSMRPDWYYEADFSEQPAIRQDDFVFEERETSSAARSCSRAAVRRDGRSVHQDGQSIVEALRGSRHPGEIQESDGLHYVGNEEPSARKLQGRGNRPDGQRRSLRSEELTACDSQRASFKPTQYGLGTDGRRASAFGRLAEPVWTGDDRPQGSLRTDSTGNSDRCLLGSGTEMQELARNFRQARVYDLANAGPRRRFTVSGVLVFNCILGLGYQMSAPRLHLTLALGNGGPKVFLPEEECKRIVNTYRRKNSRIKQGWAIGQKIIEQMSAGISGQYKCLAWEKDTLHLPNGMDLHYPNLRNLTLAKIVAKKLEPESFGPEDDFDPSWPEFVYDSKESEVKIYGGKIVENIVQALARIVVIEQMLHIHQRGHKVAMTTHDEVACIVKDKIATQVYDLMGDEMKTPPWWAMDLPLNSEGVVDVFYAK